MNLSKYSTVFCLLAVVLVKCVNKSDDQVVKNETALSGIDTASISFLRTFSLQLSEPIIYDSNSFLFYRRSNYDTSFLIEIKKDRKKYRGICYQVLPNYHRFMTDFADDTSRLLFFEGYSFVIDSTIWKKVKEKAMDIFANFNSKPVKNLKYTDGNTYAVFFDNKTFHGNSNNRDPFEELDTFLKINILGKYMRLRKPILD